MTTDHVSTPSDEGSHRHGLIGMVLDIAVRFRWAIIALTILAAIYGASRSTPPRLRSRLRRSRRK